jgi:predicted hotdog family 3-hydroxylacyl-ACP dehydratase
MVLLDRIDDWGQDFISGSTDSHRDPGNPLRRAGRLPAIAGIEIAGQAMAAHGRLIGDRTPKRGVLGSLRELALHADRLDDIAGPLAVHARLLTGGQGLRLPRRSIRRAHADRGQGGGVLPVSVRTVEPGDRSGRQHRLALRIHSAKPLRRWRTPRL